MSAVYRVHEKKLEQKKAKRKGMAIFVLALFGVVVLSSLPGTQVKLMSLVVYEEEKLQEAQPHLPALSPRQVDAEQGVASINYFQCSSRNSRTNTKNPSEKPGCRDFYPIDFFHNPQSVGYRYRQAAMRESYGHPDRLEHVNYIRFRHEEKISKLQQQLKEHKLRQGNNSTDNDNNNNNHKAVYDGIVAATTSKAPPPDFTYIHVRKAGGITLKYFGWQFQSRDVGQGYNSQIMFTVNMKGHFERNHKGNVTSVAKEMQTMVEGDGDTILPTRLFTFVRNPVSRFFSAMGQVASMRPESVAQLACPEGWDVNRYPWKAARCVLNALKAGNRVDAHLMPAAHEIHQMLYFHNAASSSSSSSSSAAATENDDIASSIYLNASVAVLPLEQLGDFMESLQVKNFKSNHQKPGSVKGRFAAMYRTLLASLSSNDTERVHDDNGENNENEDDGDMPDKIAFRRAILRDICEYYAVDVHMMRQLFETKASPFTSTIAVPECEPYVPRHVAAMSWHHRIMSVSKRVASLIAHFAERGIKRGLYYFNQSY